MLHDAEGQLYRLVSNTEEKAHCEYYKSPIFLFIDKLEPLNEFPPRPIRDQSIPYQKPSRRILKFDAEISV